MEARENGGEEIVNQIIQENSPQRKERHLQPDTACRGHGTMGNADAARQTRGIKIKKSHFCRDVTTSKLPSSFMWLLARG